MAQRLINQIPPCDVFISAFLGDCAILRRMRPAARSIGIDLDEDALATWLSRQIPGLQLYRCDAVEWLRHHFDLYRWYQAAEYCDAADGGAGSRDRRSTAPGSGAASRSGPRGSRIVAASAEAAESGGCAEGDPGAAAETSGCAQGDPGAAAKSGVDGHHRPHNPAAPAEDAESGDWSSWFVYADPPYPLDTRSSGPLYRHEMTDAQHVDLLATLQQLPCRVMLSSYPNAMYTEALADWRSFTFRAMTRGGTCRTEQVWCNYPEPAELHDPRYLGRDKREREKIRRRVKNWTEGLGRMPALERQAVLDAIARRSM